MTHHPDCGSKTYWLTAYQPSHIYTDVNSSVECTFQLNMPWTFPCDVDELIYSVAVTSGVEWAKLMVHNGQFYQEVDGLNMRFDPDHDTEYALRVMTTGKPELTIESIHSALFDNEG